MCSSDLTSGNDTQTGSAVDNLIQGGQGNDSISDSSGINLISGGTGADTVTGGAGQDNIYNPPGDQAISITTSSVSGFDTLTSFSLGNGSSSGDVLRITTSGVSPFIPTNQTAVNGNDSASGYTISSAVVALHSISNGIATFSTNAEIGRAHV